MGEEWLEDVYRVPFFPSSNAKIPEANGLAPEGVVPGLRAPVAMEAESSRRGGGRGLSPGAREAGCRAELAGRTGRQGSRRGRTAAVANGRAATRGSCERGPRA